MRLIDADAVKKDIARLHILNDEAEIRRAYASNPYSTLSDFEDTLVSVFDAIDDTPTIEADRPQGEWRPKNHHTDYCSNCGFEETQWRTADYNFCPSCGARMKGVDDEHTV